MSQAGMEYGLKGILRELLSYKTGVIAIIILLLLIGISIFTIITIPYDQAIVLWRGSEGIWLKNPRNAAPEWYSLFVGKNLPKTIILSSLKESENVVKRVRMVDGKKVVTIEYSFDYNYDDFPSELIIFFNSTYSSLPPTMNIYWTKPGEDEMFLVNYTLRSEDDKYYVSNDLDLEAKISEYVMQKLPTMPDFAITLERGLFLAYTGKLEVLKGRYKMRIEATLENPSDTFDAELVVYGKVHGIAGTDHLRRPLIIALLWGTPIALSFGLTASLITSLLQMIIATISGWYGGKVDSIIQRITEIYMILPFLPFLIMISAFYKIDIWVLLTVVIVLSIFGGGIKTTRALVMQIKSYPYVEAALAYGASDKRIIFLYIIPKILPPIVPGLISSVPGYVFLEAALSFLGLGDPYLPTWGKIINDAFSNGALYKGYFYWVLEPSAMLILTALAFSFLGFALDKIVNPKLREI